MNRNAGDVLDTGERRKTKSKRFAVVWAAIEDVPF